MLRQSIIVRILKKKAREEIYSSGQIQKVAAQAAASIRKSLEYLAVYEYDPALHTRFNNSNNALYSKGCGCAMCVARHEYVKAKDIKRKFHQSYYDDNRYIYFLQAFKASNTDLSEGSFYLWKLEILTNQVQAKRNKFKAVQQTILTVLSE